MEEHEESSGAGGGREHRPRAQRPRLQDIRAAEQPLLGEGLAAKVLTVSDGVAAGSRDDRSGPALVARLVESGFQVLDHSVSPDGGPNVEAALRRMTSEFWGLVITTGGTGFGPRDFTPEGARMVFEREASGLVAAMLAVNPLGRISRPVAGTAGSALILTVPGSTNGALEMLGAVLDVLPHAIRLMRDNQDPHPQT